MKKPPVKKLAENPEVIACAVCRRNPDGSATIIGLHGGQQYGSIFQSALNIHVCVADPELVVDLGKILLRSYRDRNYILMTEMTKGNPFSKSVKRSMVRVLLHLNNGDAQFGIAPIPDPIGHLAGPGMHPGHGIYASAITPPMPPQYMPPQPHY